jgi:small conductance mechanosensitive channel
MNYFYECNRMQYTPIMVCLTFVWLSMAFEISNNMKGELTFYPLLPIVNAQENGAEIPEIVSVDATNLDSTDQSLQQEDRMIVSSSNATSLQNSTSESLGGIDNYWETILSVVITVGGAAIIYFIARYFLQRTADSLHLDRRELKGVYSVVKLILIVISITIVVFQFSSISGVAAGAISVAVGTIIGFSSRNTISNAIAGILLLSARPFKLGDRIRTTEDEDLIGDVVEITLLYTKISTIRNELVAIPNQTLLQRQIINYSGLESLSVKVEVSLTYDKDRELIEKLLTDCAVNTNGILQHPIPPFVLLTRLEKYAANYELRAFTNKPNEFLRIQSEIRKRIYDTFLSQGIDLTVPQLQETSNPEYFPG